ncbi:MAG: hypothetical protein J5959_02355, partial [Butyrivibrio sp.]|nr:hypothetical protein [Butyrivibrio sp.]
SSNQFFDIDYGHDLSKQLSGSHPVDVCQIYWNQCDRLCSASNKKNYQQAVQVLKEIRAICKKNSMTDTWKRQFAEFVDKHQRKSLLMGYMKTEGFI